MTVAQSLLRMQILEPNQKRRNIVPELDVQFDLFDASFTEFTLQIAWISHALPREDLPIFSRIDALTEIRVLSPTLK